MKTEIVKGSEEEWITMAIKIKSLPANLKTLGQ